jgi:hypothetical protein
VTAALTLFDLTDLNPDKPQKCGWCGNKPATSRVHAVQNLLGVIPVWLGETWYRDATRKAHSGPCCDNCAWQVAGAWWNPTYACPHRGGACQLWVHTLDYPHPGWDCVRHHNERAVVWYEPLAVAS